MKELEERILKDGIVLDNDVLNVGSFLNQKVDINLLYKQAEVVKEHFSGVTKVLTIEASGLPFATLISHLYNCEMVFAKKNKSSNISGEVLTTTVKSYTKGKEFTICVNKEYLKASDNVLIVDDFLATGAALNSLIELCNKANCNIIGCAVQIEKEYQNGGKVLRDKGYDVLSLAQIKEIRGNKIIF